MCYFDLAIPLSQGLEGWQQDKVKLLWLHILTLDKVNASSETLVIFQREMNHDIIFRNNIFFFNLFILC